MNHKKHRKLYIGTLLFFIALLAVDKLILSESGPVVAGAAIQQADASETLSTPADEATDLGVEQESNTISVAQKLKDIQSERAIDLSQLTNVMRSEAANDQKSAEEKVQPAQNLNKIFIATHTIGAISLDAKGGTIIINSRAVKLGGTIDGYQLVDITESSATFSSSQGRVVLRLRKNLQ